MRSCRRSIAQGLLFPLLFAPTARAELAGEHVVKGEASFDRSGDITTIHASDGAIINYTQFSVWANEELHFVQPSSDARVLNRVLGDATHIDGGLYANGIVYIVNPAGVFFGGAAIVDVGGVYAAAGNITNEDFLARRDAFSLDGMVENAGSVESPAVALVGKVVANHGNISAPDGTIALVAGEKVLLTQLGAHLAVEVEGAAGGATGAPALEQTGSVDAGAGSVTFATGDVYSLAINHTGITRGGEIDLRAASGTVQVAGALDASDRSAGGTGGAISVTGERVALLGAQLDASGDAGGGSIRVGGDLRGAGALPNARRTFVDEGTTLRADAITTGDGGQVIVWSDEATAFHGALSARGGAAGGDGGFAEISGAALAADGDVDLSASAGAAGTLLYDPKDIVLHAGTLDGTDDPDASDTALNGASLGQVLFGTPDELATPFDVYESELEGTNASIQLQATNSISSTDTFDVTILTGNSLTMQTRNNTGDETGTSLTPGIHLTDVSFQTGGTGTITIATGTDGAGGGGTGASAGIEVANLTTAGGAVTVGTEDGGITVGDVTTQGSAAAVDGVAGGAIRVQAGDADQSGDSDVITGLLNASGGNGGTGKGGNGGVVTVQSNGAVQDIAGTTTDPTLGGGSITVAGIIDTSGGDTSGGTGATGGNGGAVQLGGARQVGLVSLGATSGPITVTGSIDTSGGNGPTGGNGGSIAIETRDSNGGAASAHITTADLVTRGGDGTAGAGGNGGLVSVNTRQSIAITGATNEADNQDPAGGGNIAIASIDTSGGNGADGRGGSGSRVTVTTQSGEVRIGPSVPTAATVIDTTGGAGHTAAGAGVGGRGGVVDVRAGTAEDDTSDLQLFGNIDAREGTSDDPDTLATDGGNVTLVAGGDIEHGGQAGPHIRTGGSVSFSADGNIGASSPIRVEGHEVEGRATNQLNVSAGGTARVDATNVGFLFLNATATTAVADIRITQEGDDGGNVIDMAGSGGQMVVNRVDTRDNQVDAEVVFSNPDDDAPDGTLVLATGTSPTSGIHAGGTLRVTSDGDLVIGTTDGTVIHSVERDPGAAAGDPLSASFVLLAADADADGSGAMRDAAGANTTGRIDMLGDADEAGELNLYAGEGVGTPGDSITISGGGNVSALNAAKIEDPDNEGQFIPDPDADTGVFIRNEVDGDLAIVTSSQFPGVFAGAVVDAGSGDIEITNEVGDLTVQSATVRAKSQDADDGPGGDITLAVEGSGDRIVLDTTAPIVSGGVQTYQGDVALARPTLMTADDGIAIEGGLDASDGDVASTVSLTATLGDEATDVTSFSVQDGVGATQAFQEFAIRTPDGGDVALDAPIVRTTGSQLYGADLALTQPTAFTAGSRIVFDKDGDQSVTAPAGGFSLDAGGTPLAIPAEATIAKADGSLTLSSSGGPVTIGDGDKLSVAGSLALSGTTVRFTDLSALDVSVTSPDTQIFARGPGAVTTPGDATVADGGTDIVANTVTFSAEPTVIGAGPAPRIATQSGTAVNPGSRVLRLPVAIREEDIANGSRVFDLAIPEIDPGHETPELEGGPVVPPFEPLVSQDEAGPGASVSREEVVAFFSCAPLGEEFAPSGCAETAPPAYGSALDTERAAEVARAYRELLGESAHARAGRESLANAATNAKAELGAAASPAGRAYLTEIARVLGQTRLLGLGALYPDVRDDLLTAVAAAIGAPNLDAARLGAAVDARAMGMQI